MDTGYSVICIRMHEQNLRIFHNSEQNQPSSTGIDDLHVTATVLAEFVHLSAM